ncbi:MAG: bifunctional aldolase/short-chain dehydrogenase [Candidatus Nitricoxidivorans perseverans]|uniref:Bifunctional aldolase/short-chain dehydrogenase n=1 Tax=Candidatus Nitricoxidivorans perseverans TaxID=2975601 RepID=A0AA49FKC0_9PROT|nr:MAG: bifunctional aldolase/short-chain dehydrogenase [Candidatus Nitricoxidivorans perseverans]
MTVNLWNDADAPEGDLAQRVYTSRLLGRDKSLVLHGGGNTSVKIREMNLVGEEEDILYIKGSGWDLETIEAGGFAPVRLAHCLKLAELESLSDPQMVNELRTHMTQASAPTPSVETILHALLPWKFVDHTHADAIVSITNTEDGAERIRELYGDKVVVVPYVMPGFDLARICALGFPLQRKPATIGMVLLNHGIFSFGDTAKEPYDRMIELVTMAEDYLKTRGAWDDEPASLAPDDSAWRFDLAALRREISKAAGSPMLVCTHANSKALAFARRADLAPISQQGTATPDHVIRTKRLPMLGRDVAAYADAYRAYFAEHAKKAGGIRTMLDPAPRVILDPEWGMATVGRSAKDAEIVADIYDHTIDVIARATRLGGFRTLAPKELFEVEYWDLEQAKLKKSGKPPAFAGEIALVTGAFSGIGRACVDSLLSRGAAVIGLDINPAIETMISRPDFLGVTCDVGDPSQIVAAIEQGARRFGGLDMLVLNAGVFPGGCRIESLADDEWRRVMAINLDANLAFLRECHPLLKLAPRRGRVVIIGSKNVPAPGPGAAAYSASKAALNQLARVAALEWGADGIRINSLHPNAVFDTGLWTPEVLESRAKHYGLTVEQYKTNNVLKVEVTSRDVAELAAEMCGPLFAKTTAAQVPVDGGNERVI